MIIRCVYVDDDQQQSEPLLDRLRRAALADEQTAGPNDWIRGQCAMDDLYPDGSRGFWRNVAFTEMDEGALEMTLAIADAIPAAAPAWTSTTSAAPPARIQGRSSSRVPSRPQR